MSANKTQQMRNKLWPYRTLPSGARIKSVLDKPFKRHESSNEETNIALRLEQKKVRETK